MKSFMLTTSFNTQIECCMEASPENRYIQLYSLVEFGWEPWATATVQIEGLTGDEVAIKNYSENSGIMQTLVGIGVVYPPHREVTSGFVVLNICNMNREKIAEYTQCGF